MPSTRPHYIDGKLIGARDLNDEQAYRLDHIRRHARFLHGSGVVCGLKVLAAPQRQAPWTVRVCPGYAIGPCGDEIEVPVAILVDIRQFFWSRPYLNGLGKRVAFVGLRPSIVDGACGCERCPADLPPDAMRLPDGYVIEILWEIVFAGRKIDLCNTATVPCPSAPLSPDVVLAEVRLPESESTPVTDSEIVMV